MFRFHVDGKSPKRGASSSPRHAAFITPQYLSQCWTQTRDSDILTVVSNCSIACMESLLCRTRVRTEIKPQGIASGCEDAWQLITRNPCWEGAAAWRAVINRQKVTTFFRAEGVKLKFHSVAAWHCDSPGTGVTVAVVTRIIRAWETARPPHPLRRWTSWRIKAIWWYLQFNGNDAWTQLNFIRTTNSK